MFDTLRLGALAIALTTLVACEPVSNPNTLPGMAMADAGTAAGLFRSVCVHNRNDMSAVPVTLGSMNVERDPASDIYYHQTYDLSFKVTPRKNFAICSMVWRPASGNTANEIAIQTVAPDATVRPPTNGLSSTAITGQL